MHGQREIRTQFSTKIRVWRLWGVATLMSNIILIVHVQLYTFTLEI